MPKLTISIAMFKPTSAATKSTVTVNISARGSSCCGGMGVSANVKGGSGHARRDMAMWKHTHVTKLTFQIVGNVETHTRGHNFTVLYLDLCTPF